MDLTMILVGGAITVAGTLLALIGADLLSEEIRTRIQQLPLWLLRRAARSLPPELNSVYEDEWRPELMSTLQNDRWGPITRLARGTAFAWSLYARRSAAGIATAERSGPLSALAGLPDLRTLSRSRRRRIGQHADELRDTLRDAARTPDSDRAEQLLRVTVTASQALLDDRDEHTAHTLTRTALPLSGQLAPGHPAVLDLRRVHAFTHLQRGDHTQAESLLLDLHADEVRAFGHRDPRTVPTLRVLHWTRAMAGRATEAETGLRELDHQLSRDTETDPRLRLHVRCMHSWTLGQTGQLDAAIGAYHQVARDRAELLGDRHPDTLDTRHSLGKLYVLAGRGAAATAVLQPLRRDRTAVQGRRHPDTLETCKYLALATWQAHPRRLRRTRRALRRILAIQWNRRPGPEHPHTLDTQHWLATLTTTETP
ncbi:tetratricopeptide repeat protein [Saccharothrix sp. AJ9571]|nr:tetratricopeptide repeat protein [Saccharothrix sp. AJ9571]